MDKHGWEDPENLFQEKFSLADVQIVCTYVILVRFIIILKAGDYYYKLINFLNNFVIDVVS
jgi:hypothetical protein